MIVRAPELIDHGCLWVDAHTQRARQVMRSGAVGVLCPLRAKQFTKRIQRLCHACKRAAFIISNPKAKMYSGLPCAVAIVTVDRNPVIRIRQLLDVSKKGRLMNGSVANPCIKIWR